MPPDPVPPDPLPPDPLPPDPRFAGLAPLCCRSCGAQVLVAKFSEQHTSVQWSLPAMRACAELGAVAARGEQTALAPGCVALRASIEAAVAAGRLVVSPP